HRADAGVPHDPGCLGQQIEARSALIARVIGRKVRADVSQPGSTEDGVDDRVGEHVSVGMPVQPAWVLDAHAAEHESPALLQGMNVVADSHPHVDETASCSLISASTTSKSSGVVSLMFEGSPSTTVTSWPVAATSCASSSPTSPASAASRCARASSE